MKIWHWENFKENSNFCPVFTENRNFSCFVSLYNVNITLSPSQVCSLSMNRKRPMIPVYTKTKFLEAVVRKNQTELVRRVTKNTLVRRGSTIPKDDFQEKDRLDIGKIPWLCNDKTGSSCLILTLSNKAGRTCKKGKLTSAYFF